MTVTYILLFNLYLISVFSCFGMYFFGELFIAFYAYLNVLVPVGGGIRMIFFSRASNLIVPPLQLCNTGNPYC